MSLDSGIDKKINSLLGYNEYLDNVYISTRRYFVDSKNIHVAYNKYDWQRLWYALQFCQSNSTFLDIGLGNGAFSKMLLDLNKDNEVQGVDFKENYRNTALSEYGEKFSFLLKDITKEVLNNEKEVVVAMEVLEHLSYKDLPFALGELRASATERLLITLPYREAYPLHNEDLPFGHKQSFDAMKIEHYFPNAWVAELPRPSGCSIIFIIEDNRAPKTDMSKGLPHVKDLAYQLYYE